MKYILTFLFFCLALGQIQRIPIFNDTGALYFHDIFLIAYVVYSLTKILIVKTTRRVFFKELYPFVPLIVTAIVSFVLFFWRFTVTENIIAGAYIVRLLLLIGFFIVIQKEKKNIRELLFSLTIVLLLLTGYGQYFLYPNFWPLIYLGWDPHVFRAVGLFFDPTIAGLVYSMVGMSAFMTYVKKKDNLFLLASILFIPLLFLTYSRITYIAIIANLGYYFFSKKKFQYFVVITLLCLFGLFLLPRPEGAGVQLERVFSIKSRVVENKNGITLFLKNPILGVGYNRIREAKHDAGYPYIGHGGSGFPSSFMTILASMGLFGIVSLLFMLKKIWDNSLFEQKILLVLLITVSVFENVLFIPFVFIMFSLCNSLFSVSNEKKF